MTDQRAARASGSAYDASRLRFSVDTHILRELASLLVGRDSTALLELVKNAHDADAKDRQKAAQTLEEWGWP